MADLAAHQYRALTLLYAILVWASLHEGAVHSGHAPYYDKGLMEQVSRTRDLPWVDCMVSSPRYPVGTWVWVYGSNTGALLWCRVTDESADTDTSGQGRRESDRQRHLRLGWEAELGNREAQKNCGIKAMKNGPKACPITVIRL